MSFGILFNGELVKIIEFIKHFRTINEGMNTSYKYIRHLMTLLMKPHSLTEQEQKEWLVSMIDMFIEQKIILASEGIAKNAQDLIQNGTSLLVYARSYLIENFLIQAIKSGKQYTIFVVDNPPFHEGRQLMERLKAEGVTCFYLLLSHVSYILNKVKFGKEHRWTRYWWGLRQCCAMALWFQELGQHFWLVWLIRTRFHSWCSVKVTSFQKIRISTRYHGTK